MNEFYDSKYNKDLYEFNKDCNELDNKYLTSKELNEEKN